MLGDQAEKVGGSSGLVAEEPACGWVVVLVQADAVSADMDGFRSLQDVGDGMSARSPHLSRAWQASWLGVLRLMAHSCFSQRWQAMAAGLQLQS